MHTAPAPAVAAPASSSDAFRYSSGSIAQLRAADLDDVGTNEQQANEANGPTEGAVVSWLRDELRLPQYVGLFLEEGWDDLEVICKKMNEEELKRLGVSKRGHINKIMVYIEDNTRTPDDTLWMTARRYSSSETNCSKISLAENVGPCTNVYLC